MIVNLIIMGTLKVINHFDGVLFDTFKEKKDNIIPHYLETFRFLNNNNKTENIKTLKFLYDAIILEYDNYFNNTFILSNENEALAYSEKLSNYIIEIQDIKNK